MITIKQLRTQAITPHELYQTNKQMKKKTLKKIAFLFLELIPPVPLQNPLQNVEIHQTHTTQRILKLDKYFQDITTQLTYI